MRAAAWFDRIWEQFVTTLARSRSLTLALIFLFTALAVLLGSILTPDTNVNSIPFVIPTLFAAFQGIRWVWLTSATMLLLYLVLAFSIENVPSSASIVNTFGLSLFAVLFTWLARDRQRTRNQTAELQMMERNLVIATRRSNVRLSTQDTDLRYTWVSNAASPFSSDQMLGWTDEDLFSPVEAERMSDIKRQAMLNEREVHQVLGVTFDGEPRTFDLTAVPTYAEVDGVARVNGVTCIAVDVTDTRRIISEREELVLELEETLAQAARAQENLERFTSMIAHDLLQPLTVIQGHVSLLRGWLDPNAPDRQRRAIDSFSRAVAQMRRLIDDLRDVAALEQGSFTLDTHPVDLVPVLRGVTSDYQSTDQTHNINLYTPEHLWGHVDPSRIRQLFGNLLSNAIKYSPDGGDIDVAVSVERNTCIVEITDNGLGMSPEDFGALFEKFSRLDQSHSIQGLGLGLYICKGIARAHGGDITVASEPGLGSTFTVTLPLGPRVNFAPDVQQDTPRGERTYFD